MTVSEGEKLYLRSRVLFSQKLPGRRSPVFYCTDSDSIPISETIPLAGKCPTLIGLDLVS